MFARIPGGADDASRRRRSHGEQLVAGGLAGREPAGEVPRLRQEGGGEGPGIGGGAS